MRGATLPRDVDFSDDVDPIPHHREPLKSAADTHCRVSRRIAADVSHDGIREYTKRDQFKPLTMDLVWPGRQYLPEYIQALQRGWSPDHLRPQTTQDQLAHIARDPDGFVAAQVDRDANGPPIVLPDNSTAPRLPGFKLWMWDGDFCGSIGFRWQPGTPELPSYCLGHIGYGVVPWKRGRGYATRALQLLLPHVRAVGLPYVELTTDADNIASQRVIEANGGVIVERFRKPAVYGGAESLRFRIVLSDAVT